MERISISKLLLATGLLLSIGGQVNAMQGGEDVPVDENMRPLSPIPNVLPARTAEDAVDEADDMNMLYNLKEALGKMGDGAGQTGNGTGQNN